MSSIFLKNIKTNSCIGPVINFPTQNIFFILKGDIEIKNNGYKESLCNYLLQNNNSQNCVAKVTRNSFCKFLKIQNAVVGIKIFAKDLLTKYRESNEDAKIKSSKLALWKIIEIEYKYNINKNGKSFINYLSEEEFGNFDFGHSTKEYTSERYCDLNSGDKEIANLDILDATDKYEKSIKYFKDIKCDYLPKKELNIIAFNRANLEKAVADLTSKSLSEITLTPLKKFEKEKNRCVCINKRNGMVFGISSHRIKVKKTKHILNQIEIEFWSRILPSNRNSSTNDPLLKSTIEDLYKLIEDKLILENYKPLSTKISKYNFIKSVSDGETAKKGYKKDSEYQMDFCL
ncbi:MAG: hypothetical protein ABIE03_02615 [Patescibacteria group bacterium]|nr:hypothetical protein [Patescibacteria group bacterium]